MDVETKMAIDRIWEAVNQLQHNVDRLLPPKHEILHKPIVSTEESLKENVKRAVTDSKKTESFLTQQKPTSFHMQDSWSLKPSGWTAKQWEDWARKVYYTYSDARQYLPEWFIKTLE